MQTSHHKIKALNVTLEELYNQDKQLRVHLTSNKQSIYTLVLIGRDKEPDFLLSSFRENYYCRSNYGMNRKKYSSLQAIEKAVERLVNRCIDDNVQISYSIGESVDIF